MINVPLVTTLLISAKHLQTLFEGYMLVKQDFQAVIYF